MICGCWIVDWALSRALVREGLGRCASQAPCTRLAGLVPGLDLDAPSHLAAAASLRPGPFRPLQAPSAGVRLSSGSTTSFCVLPCRSLPLHGHGLQTLGFLPAGRDNQVSVFLSRSEFEGLVLGQLQAWTGSEEGGLLEDLQIACRSGPANYWEVAHVLTRQRHHPASRG